MNSMEAHVTPTEAPSLPRVAEEESEEQRGLALGFRLFACFGFLSKGT